VAFAQSLKTEDVKKEMKRVADWPIEHFDQCYSNPQQPHHPLAWHNRTLYVGMVKWAAMAEDSTYWEWMKNIAVEHKWQLHERKYHADDHTVGQMYCELYRKYGDKEMIAPTINQFDFIMYHPSQSALNWKTPYHQDRWNWCDALFMSPLVWAKLYKITGGQKYLDFMVGEYKATTDFLFNKKESLNYRDESYFGKLDNVTKIFWGRGNG
jgi:rhamnogalacturonyl hydrolase YesR